MLKKTYINKEVCHASLLTIAGLLLTIIKLHGFIAVTCL